MLYTKFEKLKRINNQKRLLEKLTSIDCRFSKNVIDYVSVDYQELVDVSKKYLVSSEVANGSKVDNIDVLLFSFGTFIKNYIDKYGNSIFKIIIPFNNEYFKVSVELNVLSDNYDKLVDVFFRLDNNTSEEILIYKNSWQAGLCLFREEHRYYISIW